MTDYMSVVMNGAATGVGVIFAQKAWAMIEKHYDRIANHKPPEGP